MSHVDPGTTVRGRVGAALIFVTAGSLTASAIPKFTGSTAMVPELEAFGFAGIVPLIAALEAGVGLLLLAAPTRRFGLFMGSAFLGGAIATHLQHDRFPHAIAPIAVLAVLWLGAWLRHPELVLGSPRPDRADDRIATENARA